MLEEKETNEPDEQNQNDQPATPSGESDPSTSNESLENNDNNDSPENKSAEEQVDDILTAEEQQRKTELEAAAAKTYSANDLKAAEGRERKANQDKITELQEQIIDLQKQLVNNNANDNSGDSQDNNPFGNNSDEFYNPDRPWYDPDTQEIDWSHGVPQHLLREYQKQGKEISSFKTLVSDLQETLTGLEKQRVDEQTAQEWKNKFGLSDDALATFQALKSSEGEAAAFEYLSLQKKEIDAQRAAQELQTQQRQTMPVMSTGNPQQGISETDSNVEALAQEIADMPIGTERTIKAGSLHEQLPTEIASAVLQRAVELTIQKQRDAA